MGGKKKQYFGTDGIRGTVGEAPITPDFMLKLGWAAGKVFAKKGNGRNKVLIGKDTRISGYMFEAALESGIAAAGVDIYLLGPMPTPAVAYLTRTLRAQAGIVISASHNQFEDNGIKFFSDQGTKLEDAVELAIEDQLNGDVTTVASDALGKATRLNDAAGRYIEFCKSTVGSSLKFNGLKVVLDCANGSTYHIAPAVFEELGARVKAIGVTPDGLNINRQCGSTAPESLQRAVIEEQADVGIAFDGDGDRVIMVDHQGNLVDGDEILYVIARDRQRRGIDFGGVVGTKMTNLGLELALKRMDVPFTRTDVGDRYVLAEMLARKWDLGGESSGHIICQDINTTGDGIVSALQAMEALVHFDQPLADVKKEMRKMPQSMINVRLPGKLDISANKVVQAAVAEVESELGASGRVLLRPSGTEPVIRVMVEGEEADTVDKLAQELSQVVATVVT